MSGEYLSNRKRCRHLQAALTTAVFGYLFLVPCAAFILGLPALDQTYVSSRVHSTTKQNRHLLCGVPPPLASAIENGISHIPHPHLEHLPHLPHPHFPHPHMHLPRKSFLVGNVWASMRRMLQQSRPALEKILHAVDPPDLAIILLVAFGSESILRVYNERIMNGVFRRNRPKDFESSKLRSVAQIICQLGQCAFAAYLAELFIVFLEVLGMHFHHSAPRTVALCIYAVWTARKLSRVKTRFLNHCWERLLKKKSHRTTVLYDRLFDVALYTLASIIVLDLLRVQIGVVFKSLLSVAGLSSLIVGLSLREPAAQILQGTINLLSDEFRPGDKIRLEDGTVGRVLDIGWLDTTLRCTDNYIARIPNSEIAGKRVYNVSRIKRSRVKQNLRFRYSDIDKIPVLMQDIKEEIRKSCPKLITDGSRTFKVHWRDFQHDHIGVVVNAHFDIPPETQAYLDNQETVLLAIARAVKKNNVRFALPYRVYAVDD